MGGKLIFQRVARMTKLTVVRAKVDSYGAQKENILIALDENSEVLGSVCIYPFFAYDTEPEHPHNLYIHFRAERGQYLDEPVKDVLLENALRRAAEVKSQAGQVKTRVYACFFEYQKAEIAYFVSRGFIHDESMYILERENGREFPYLQALEGITIKSWRMNAESEQKLFIETHREIFPRHPYTPESLHKLKMLPGWNDYVAMSDTKIAGNIMVYFKDENNGIGYIEDLFVQAKWRRRGIAKNLVATALRYFQDAGINRVQLEGWSANKAAMELYGEFDFKPIRETEIAVGRYV